MLTEPKTHHRTPVAYFPEAHFVLIFQQYFVFHTPAAFSDFIPQSGVPLGTSLFRPRSLDVWGGF